MASLNSLKQNKKPSCPFGRHCLSDSSICGYMGYYAECPQVRVDGRLVEAIQHG
ncbi:hypothetical protein J5U23_02424 [Saccharolobus shibatae B12]|uniref:Uncharacterized protein n=1 Tax=Saccharolobus shibatae (strain ATCC 51178 / DSM 5389 / JCM 8931 / NBRC 15437 / B12) TaxID=523848 RepID=A0A8F5BQD8_SACSH|nr:CopG family transcriptional regulator [Saccharolobus shibatae]QXJ29555.1 hypothetical protein J5U23_02424 [Saccharolobus shibatae B12]